MARLSDETNNPGLKVVKGGAEGVGDMIDNAEPVKAGDTQPADPPADDTPPIDDVPDGEGWQDPFLADDDDRPYRHRDDKVNDQLPDEMPVTPLDLNGDFFITWTPMGNIGC